MNNRFLVLIIALFVGFGAIFWLAKNDSGPTATNNQEVKATEHRQGAGNKKVTLVEYGDFECPACGQYYFILKEVKSKFGDDITFQFRHFPLVQIHRNAMAAHRAAEAAGLQGKFFEMHDKLYEQQDAWKSSSAPAGIFEGYAQELGLDLDRFKTDVASSNVNDLINKDIREGQSLAVNSTPSFVLNGRKVEQNPRDLESFIKLIEDEIAKQD